MMEGFFKRIGPAFVVGACIIGPGSITVMSKTGAKYAYSMLWLALFAGVITCCFVAFFMRFGIYSQETFFDVIRRRLGPAGKLSAVLCGVSLASTDVLFQFGNCLGVTTGMHVLFKGVPQIIWPFLFTGAAIVFMFGFKKIYKIIERLMAFFLVLMLGAFTVNLVNAGPEMGEAAKGLLPAIPAEVDMVTLGGLVGTTFCLVAVVFQAYVVKAKGWGEKDLANGLTDTITALAIVTLLGCIMMMTAAAIVHPGDVSTPADLASQLKDALGDFGEVIFGVGFCAAAFSSFVTNSVIGGTILNDAFSLGGKIDSKATKFFATLVLLVGLATSLVIIEYKPDFKVIAIALGQAATMLAIPLGAVAAVIVLFDRDAVKGRVLTPWAKGLVGLGVVVLIGISATLFSKVSEVLEQL